MRRPKQAGGEPAYIEAVVTGQLASGRSVTLPDLRWNERTVTAPYAPTPGKRATAESAQHHQLRFNGGASRGDRTVSQHLCERAFQHFEPAQTFYSVSERAAKEALSLFFS